MSQSTPKNAPVDSGKDRIVKQANTPAHWITKCLSEDANTGSFSTSRSSNIQAKTMDKTNGMVTNNPVCSMA